MSSFVSLDVFDTPFRLRVTDSEYHDSSLRECSLTVIEGELLFLLLKNRQATREMCESVLWRGRIVSDSSRSLTQVVSTLRKKLRQFGIEDLILTKPRLGYVLTQECDIKNLAELLSVSNPPSSNTCELDILKAKKINFRLVTAVCVLICSCVISFSTSFRWYQHDHVYNSLNLNKSYFEPIFYDKNSDENMLNPLHEFKIEENVIGFDDGRKFIWRNNVDGWTGFVVSSVEYRSFKGELYKTNT